MTIHPTQTAMSLRPAAFAIPGDIERKTGGYIYERQLLLALRRTGRNVDFINVPDGFPHPSAEVMGVTMAAMAAVPAERPLIIDGLIFGSIDPSALDAVVSPIVAMIHHPVGLETGLSPERSRFLVERERDNLRRAAHVVVPSPHTARILAADFDVEQERISVALPGFEQPGRQKTVKDEPPLILCVGLMAERKGHDVLVQALHLVTDLEWQAEIIGGPHDPAVTKHIMGMIAERGLGQRVHLRGLIGEEALAQAYRRAAIFALATRYEGYGIVFGEAMSHGLPIVSCRTGAVPDTVPADAGILVPVDDAFAFADGLRRLLEHPSCRRKMAARSAAQGHSLPTWDQTAAVMGAVLDRADKR